MSSVAVTVILVLFIAALVRATFGFGDALVGMSVLTLLVGVQVAAAVVAFMSIIISLAIIWESWREVDFRSAGRLVAAGAIGVPVGIWLLHAVPEPIVVGGLGIFLCGFSLYSLAKPALPNLFRDQTHSVIDQRWAYLCGFLAGCLGGAYNVHGPPVVVYGVLRHWDPSRFRATLQGFFLPSGLFILAGHGLSGMWTTQVLTLAAWGAPAILGAVFVGGRINRRLEPEHFQRLLHSILLILGLLLLFNTFS